MKTSLSLLALAIIAPFSAHAQNGAIGGNTIPEYLQSFIGFINFILVPLLFAVAFVVFIYGIFNYFIAGGANEEKRDEGKQLAVWGIIGFFVMVSVWGLVNVLVGTFGFRNTNAPPLPTFSPGAVSAPRSPSAPVPQTPTQVGENTFY
jgi:hypothetical protein